jgi:pyruvate dehydrogenase E2 component (dihydrolipoamide acetyltransferase)
MPETISMPKLGFDMAEGLLVRWVKLEGEAINKGDVLAEIETDKATVEVESSVSGTVARHLVEKGTSVPVNTPIAIIALPGEKLEEVAAGAAAPSAPAAPAPKAEEPKSRDVVPADEVTAPVAVSSEVKASPLARKMAIDADLDLRGMRGSGPDGRIVKRDVEAALKAPPAVAAPVAAAAPSAAPAPTPVKAAPVFMPGEVPADQHIPLDRLRTAIGRRMAESKQQVPHFYITSEYDVAELLRIRVEVNSFQPEDAKLSVNDFIIKAIALTLCQFPNLNASLGEKEIIRHGHVNVGVAVAVEGGLLTVVCKDADQKPLRQISAEIKEMVARARLGKVRPDDIEGSTFSISNLGMFGVEHFAAIINPPEAAILAVGAAKQVPVVVDGGVTVGSRMQATISADHRVTDGAEAAQFMQALGTFLEHPLRLLV